MACLEGRGAGRKPSEYYGLDMKTPFRISSGKPRGTGGLKVYCQGNASKKVWSEKRGLQSVDMALQRTGAGQQPRAFLGPAWRNHTSGSLGTETLRRGFRLGLLLDTS